jgi:homoserine dehydrogenase
MRHLFNDQLDKQMKAQGYSKETDTQSWSEKQPGVITVQVGDRQRDIDMLLAVVEAQRQVIAANQRELVAKELYIKHECRRVQQPLAFTTGEGEMLLSWRGRGAAPTAYAIIFDDGSLFEMATGWRDGGRPDHYRLADAKAAIGMKD